MYIKLCEGYENNIKKALKILKFAKKDYVVRAEGEDRFLLDDHCKVMDYSSGDIVDVVNHNVVETRDVYSIRVDVNEYMSDIMILSRLLPSKYMRGLRIFSIDGEVRKSADCLLPYYKFQEYNLPVKVFQGEGMEYSSLFMHLSGNGYNVTREKNYIMADLKDYAEVVFKGACWCERRGLDDMTALQLGMGRLDKNKLFVTMLNEKMFKEKE